MRAHRHPYQPTHHGNQWTHDQCANHAPHARALGRHLWPHQHAQALHRPNQEWRFGGTLGGAFAHYGAHCADLGALTPSPEASPGPIPWSK